MNASAIEVTSANYSTDAVRDIASGSKHRAIGESLKALFKAAVKVITRRDDEGQPRTRSGEKESGGMVKRVLPKLTGKAAAHGRYAGLRDAKTTKAVFHGAFADAADDASSKVYAETGLFLADNQAWLQFWEDNAKYVQIQDNHFSATIQDQYFPQP